MCNVIQPDVLVVGLGPAGAKAAAAAASAGASVLAVDRKKQAGVPVQCAEFVPRMIGMEVGEVSRSCLQPIGAMETYAGDGAAHVMPDFTGVMIDREKFDRALVDEALAAGADCRFGILVRAIRPDGVVLLSNGSEVAPSVIIGADGPRSLVGRMICSQNTELVETRQIQVRLCHPHHATDIFLSAGIPGGYAWLFPRGEVANLGLGIAPAWRHLLKPALDDLHEHLVSEGRVGSELLGCTGGAIPVGGLRQTAGRLGRTQVLLAGDAAGLTNPVTGAGIPSAVISGRQAGVSAAQIIAGEPAAAEKYAEELSDLFAPALDRGLARRRALMDIYNAGHEPAEADLKRNWIAFPEYWVPEHV
ncbi:MAG: geranylgeranyl reductase family protein [Hyphomicrobiaceae bacterium]